LQIDFLSLPFDNEVKTKSRFSSLLIYSLCRLFSGSSICCVKSKITKFVEKKWSRTWTTSSTFSDLRSLWNQSQWTRLMCWAIVSQFAFFLKILT